MTNVLSGLHAVYYDAETDQLKNTDEMALTCKPTFEGDGDKIVIVQREGQRFADAEYGEKSISLNFDNEGDDEETLTFSREEGGYYHGLKMTLQSVSFASGDSKAIDITATKFQILKESTNDMPDIIGDNYLYRWDGSRYEEYMWDGTNLVKTI